MSRTRADESNKYLVYCIRVRRMGDEIIAKHRPLRRFFLGPLKGEPRRRWIEGIGRKIEERNLEYCKRVDRFVETGCRIQF